MTALLSLRNARVAYGAVVAVEGVDLDVGEGELVTLLGANGAGKSSLLRALSGLEKLEGEATFLGRDLHTITPADRARLGLVHVPEGRGIFAPLSVEENLQLGGLRLSRAALAAAQKDLDFMRLDADAFAAWERALGPEPLDPELTAERFSGIIRGSSSAVKSILMDQKRLAGVGNIYANEALWRARVRPARRGAQVTHPQCAVLLGELRAVLTESIALRGTTFRDYRDAYGGRGGFAEKLQAYGREGAPCVRCGAALAATHAIEGRQTVWCRSCQR